MEATEKGVPFWGWQNVISEGAFRKANMFGLARQYLQRRYEEGFEEGFEESYREAYLKLLQQGHIKWDSEAKAWNARRLEAERHGKKFKEPPPGFKEALRRALARRRCPCCQEIHHGF